MVPKPEGAAGCYLAIEFYLEEEDEDFTCIDDKVLSQVVLMQMVS